MFDIPWSLYSEEEVQAILTVLFRKRGYHVYDIHKVDKRGERGVDLECKRTGEKDGIIMAVKKKPRGKDVLQLNKFIDKTAKAKIYVYVEEPTTQFKKEMTKFEDRVSFWDSGKLTSEIFSTDVYFYLSLIIENHFLKDLYQITMSFCQIYFELEKGKGGKKEPVKADYEMLNLLWAAKDKSASLHRSLRILQMFFEGSSLSEIDEKQKESIIDGYLVSLSELARNSLVPLRMLFSEFLRKYPANFVRFCVETKGRSNWFYFLQNIPRLSPGHVIKTLEDTHKSEIEIKKLLAKIISKSEEEQDLAPILGDISRTLAIGAYWLEDTVDKLFSIGLFGHWDAMGSKFHSFDFEDIP